MKVGPRTPLPSPVSLILWRTVFQSSHEFCFFGHEVCFWKGAGTPHGFDASLAWSQKECIAMEDFTRVVAFPTSQSQGDVGAVNCR